MTGPGRPLVRVEDAGLGAEAQVRLVVSGLTDLDRLQRAWSSSGANLRRTGDRVVATTTVEALARAAGRALPPAEARELERSLRAAVDAWGALAPPVPLPGGDRLDAAAVPLVMGVVNVTPDSFSDGGCLYPDGHPASAVDFARGLLADGAALLDVGGESTRPGSEPVAEDEELRRVVPVVEALAADGAIVSIDTTKPRVARAALAAGAQVLNDVSGGRDPALLSVAAETGAAYVLMHTRGRPADMQSQAVYDDVVAEVYEFLADGLERCAGAGLPAERILVDPGIGFAKTTEHNLALLRDLRQLRGLGRPVLVGASRKSFIGRLLDQPVPAERVAGSLACAVVATLAGAAVVRSHDVADTVRAMRVAAAVAAASPVPADPADPAR